ncbi:MAG: DUF5654 family protein [Candidatus Thermoplasmatota archaeon]
MGFKSEVIDKMSSLMTAAFGLIAALAWNDAVKQAIDQLGFKTLGPWIYAIIVTILAVIVTIWIGRIATKLKDKQ